MEAREYISLFETFNLPDLTADQVITYTFEIKERCSTDVVSPKILERHSSCITQIDDILQQHPYCHEYEDLIRGLSADCFINAGLLLRAKVHLISLNFDTGGILEIAPQNILYKLSGEKTGIIIYERGPGNLQARVISHLLAGQYQKLPVFCLTENRLKSLLASDNPKFAFVGRRVNLDQETLKRLHSFLCPQEI